MKASLEHIPLRWFLILVMLCGIVLYAYRLSETTVFIADIARDATRSLELWRNKELTLIGPPASFGQRGTRELYFGSFSLYLGMLGLLLGGFNPIAATMLGIILLLCSVPCMYLFLKGVSQDEYFSRLGTLFYVLSPLTVSHARFFWNANFLIPFSVFLGLAIVRKRFLFAGLLLGVMINFHYACVLYGGGYLLYLLLKRRYKEGGLLLAGTLLASVPLIVFELRNEFYLTHALLFNLQKGSGSVLGLMGGLITSLIKVSFTFVGMLPAEISYPTLLPVELSRYSYAARYLFPIYPLLVWVLTRGLMLSKLRRIHLLVLLLMGLTSVGIVMRTPLEKEYIPLTTIEKVSAAIVQDSPQAPYNITENIIGDARAISFRYFLLRDADVQPEGIESYQNLQTLYAVSPSKEKIYAEKRWEFTATPDLMLKKDQKIDSVHVYTFAR